MSSEEGLPIIKRILQNRPLFQMFTEKPPLSLGILPQDLRRDLTTKFTTGAITSVAETFINRFVKRIFSRQ